MSAPRRRPADAADAADRPDIDVVREALDDEYEVLEELGRGGMATVYRARERQLGRDVALKVLPFRLSHDAELVARFEREARTAARLEHPHIVPIHRVGRSGRVIYFAMQLLRGESLGRRLRTQGIIPTDELRRILVETAGALGHAHASGIVHRDVKPDNILLGANGRCMVTDFGIARSTTDVHLTASGMSMGTPRYMSPEQARATDEVDGRSDLYSLGVVGYECLTGRAPFEGTDPMAIMFGHVQLPLPVPTIAMRGSADERELYAVIERLLAKQPGSRYQTAEELIEALTSGSSGRRRALAQAAAEARYAPVAEPPQSAAALDSALEAGVELIRRQRPRFASIVAAGQRFLSAVGLWLRTAGIRLGAAPRRGAEGAPAISSRLGQVGAIARQHSRWLTIGAIACAAVVGGGWYAANATGTRGGRCAALVADGGTARFTVLVERVGQVTRGSDVDLYYDVCNIAPGPFRTRVTLSRPTSGFQRLLGNGVDPINLSYEETAGRGAIRRHRAIALGNRPAGTYTLGIIVTDESGRRREKYQAIHVVDK